jgi:AcrR family transcriptional regulator
VTERREVRRRPGGRSARVTAAVHQAVDALVTECGPGGFTVADVARRADVNPTSIHRRWGSLEAVILEVEAARLTEISPLPDSGSLRGDLLAYAQSAAADITRPGRLAFLQALIGARHMSAEQRSAPLLERAKQLQTMLDRATDRGEPSIHFSAVVDCIIAPVYLRYLLGMGIDATDFDLFVDRTLTSSTPPNTH